MGLFGKLLKTTFDVVTLPISIVKDVVTLGGALTDQDDPYTLRHLSDVDDDLGEVKSELNDL